MEPTSLATLVAEQIKRLEPGTRPYEMRQMILRAHQANRERRAAVLKHDDLARRLITELGFKRAEQWNGYIPPAEWPIDDGELLREHRALRGGEMVVHFNQLGHRSCGTQPNDSPRRMLLMEISAEAWRREHETSGPGRPPQDGHQPATPTA